MKPLVMLLLGLAMTAQVRAPDATVPWDLDDLVEAGQDFLRQNIDPQILEALPELDQDKVREFFQEVQERLRGEYVVDLAAVKAMVTGLLPLLESHEATQPYAEWLKTRLDYFEVAEQYQSSQPPPRVEPGQPPKPVPNPGPEIERRLWRQQLVARPAPAGAEKLASQLKPIFRAQRIPGELVWLAEVESSFNSRERSPAGAAGLFQLMPATAKRYGLSLWLPDERYSPEKSARAAAQHLYSLHRKFKDWPLALAAYNAGEGNVQRLLDKYQARSFDRIATHLPAETQLYVPKIDATLQRREGLSLAKLPPPR